MFGKFPEADPSPIKLEKVVDRLNMPSFEPADASVEKAANFEGNDIEILISRLRDPIIFEQLVNIFHDLRVKEHRLYLQAEWEPYRPEGWTEEDRFNLMRTEVIGPNGEVKEKMVEKEFLDHQLQQPEPTREEVAEELNQNINDIATKTDIDLSTNTPNAGAICLNWKMPWTDKPETPSEKQWAIIAAHEKGHRIRSYWQLDEEFKKAFDISVAKEKFTDRDLEMLRINDENEEEHKEESEPLTDEEYRDNFLEGYLFTAMEIAERMSQLKNYFGFSGSEEFTSEHLAYAKEHYLEDTKFDNGMRLFFEAITPETEEKFLHLINNYGI